MKTSKHTFKSISVFALALIMLLSIVLPLSAAGSSPDNAAMGTYTVKSGDTLSKIASSYGVTVSSIVNANGISASSTLYTGQTLKIPGATSIEDDTSTLYGSSNTVTIDFKDADVKGVLSAILAHTSYTMIFKGDTSTVTISLKDVSPMTAVDYVLRMVGMTYIKNDSIIYVGTADTLNSDFVDSHALTKFRLKYMSVDIFLSQLSKLGISATVIQRENHNDRGTFWVSGYPMQLAKIRQLMDVLDTSRNVTLGSDSITSYLTQIKTTYITASQLSSLLDTLGLPKGILFDAHPNILYVYATGSNYDDIMKIKKLVDTKEASKQPTNPSGGGTTTITDGTTTLTRIDLKYITKEDVSSLITAFGYKVEVCGTDLNKKTIWIRGISAEVDKAVAQIKENDIATNNSERTFFTYNLTNIVADELQQKISRMNLEGVEFYFGAYPTLTKSIIVYCPVNKVESTKELIASLDNNLGKIYYPIATITSTADLASIPAEEALVVKMLNNPSITTGAFILSENLDSAGGVRYILYVYESSENITLILNMWNKVFSSSATSSSTPSK